MGFPVQTLAPKVTVQNRTFCTSAFEYSNIAGTFYCAGIFEQQNDGSWNRVITFVEQSAGILELIQAKGGKVELIKWLIEKINAYFVELFGATPVPSTEPTTEKEAKDVISLAMLDMAFTVVNGIPVLAQIQE